MRWRSHRWKWWDAKNMWGLGWRACDGRRRGGMTWRVRMLVGVGLVLSMVMGACTAPVLVRPAAHRCGELTVGVRILDAGEARAAWSDAAQLLEKAQEVLAQARRPAFELTDLTYHRHRLAEGTVSRQEPARLTPEARGGDVER